LIGPRDTLQVVLSIDDLLCCSALGLVQAQGLTGRCITHLIDIYLATLATPASSHPIENIHSRKVHRNEPLIYDTSLYMGYIAMMCK
jgi:hypothetical protein